MAEASVPAGTTFRIRHVHIECPICISRFTDPKLLDCLHIFCLKCLEELKQNDPKTDTITCPVCRKETAIPDTGLSYLLNCFFLSSLLDDVNNQEGLNEDSKTCFSTCEGCDKGLDAVSRCVDCNAQFCKKCLENHANLKFTKRHRILKVDGSSKVVIEEKRKTVKCRKHTDHELCFYCDKCDLLACPKCLVFDHRASNHNISEINDSIRSHRQNVEEALKKFDDCRKQFQKKNDSIKHSQHRLQLMVDRALRDIVAKEEEETAKIRKASHLLQERVMQIGRERGGEYESILGSNRDKMNRAEQIVASVNDLMQYADDFELMDLKPKVMHNLEFYKKLRFGSVQHSKSFVEFKGHDIVNDVYLGDVLENEKWELKIEFGKEVEDVGEFKLAADVACFSNGDIIVLDTEQHRISTFTSTGYYKSTGVRSEAYEGKLKNPWSAVVTPDDLLMVTDGRDVKVYDSELVYIRQFRPSQDEIGGHSESRLDGIAVDKMNRVAVADLGRKVISLHNMDGSIISSIPCDDIGVFCPLAISSKERLIISNDEEEKLVCLDFTGNEVFNISTSIDGEPVKPAGLCCDDAGNVYISILDNGDVGTFSVHHYDASGRHIGLVAHGLDNPAGMTFTPNGDLVVADMNSVKIFHQKCQWRHV